MTKARRYNEHKPKWSLVHFQSLIPMIRVLEYGANKYNLYINVDTGAIRSVMVLSNVELESGKWILYESGKDNWKKDMNLSEILNSMQRHLAALMDGEILDSESGLSHMGHIQCNALFYNYHYDKQKTTKTTL